MRHSKARRQWNLLRRHTKNNCCCRSHHCNIRVRCWVACDRSDSSSALSSFYRGNEQKAKVYTTRCWRKHYSWSWPCSSSSLNSSSSPSLKYCYSILVLWYSFNFGATTFQLSHPFLSVYAAFLQKHTYISYTFSIAFALSLSLSLSPSHFINFVLYITKISSL